MGNVRLNGPFQLWHLGAAQRMVFLPKDQLPRWDCSCWQDGDSFRVDTNVPQPAFLTLLPDFCPRQACRSLSLSLASFSFIVTRPQIFLWLSRPESKGSLAEGWDLCHVSRDRRQRIACCQSRKGLEPSLQGPRAPEPVCTPL